MKAILAKRKEFEYRLRRFEARKMDFMRYVEHETNLEALRSMRARRIHRNRQRRKDSRADSCCVRLVRSIFDRALAKFPADVDLWLHYIDFVAQQKQARVRPHLSFCVCVPRGITVRGAGGGEGGSYKDRVATPRESYALGFVKQG